MRTLPLLALFACSDYGLKEEHDDPPGAGTQEIVYYPSVDVSPVLHDFGVIDLGATDAVPVTVTNVGEADLTVSALDYIGSEELRLDVIEAENGPLPWTLVPGEERQVSVAYVPVDYETADVGELVVTSDDPLKPRAFADQTGRARPFEGFSTGWYIIDDSTVYETVGNPDYVVDRVGDPDGFWYEPSGVHALMGSADPVADWITLHDWIIAGAGAPTPVTGPLTFRGASAVPELEGASFTYILCDFWLDYEDDPALYTISSGVVDDGIIVMVNGNLLGHLEYAQSGSWPLTGAVAGEVNTLVVMLQDNAAVEKYLVDLAFYRDGVMVTGE